MSILYYCKNKQRKNFVIEQLDPDGNPIPNKINGIDYLEIASSDQKTINIFFIHPLPGQPNEVPPNGEILTVNNIVISGGERIKNIKVKEIKSVADNLLKIVVDQAGDFSTYTLSLILSSGFADPPPGFDPLLSSIDFSFKVTCPNDFDCKIDEECPPEVYPQPNIDYLAKDYNSFRRLMLDRMNILIPGWTERNPADIGIALVELLAYIADHLSYYQDAVANEAYLGTAKKRISVRRHARLLDYRINDGCNSRVWVHIEVDKGGDADGKLIPKGTPLITGGNDEKPAVKDLNRVMTEIPVIFETMHDIILNNSHNKLSFYTWGNSECCLPQGSTSATLLKDSDINIRPGDVLIFEEIKSPLTGIENEADLNHRHSVRLSKVEYKKDPLLGKDIINIEWFTVDALPFPLCITARVTDQDNKTEIDQISIALGNIVLADHGITIVPANDENPLNPSQVSKDEINYRPNLKDKNITFSGKYNDSDFKKVGAANTLIQNINNVLPQIILSYEEEIWIPRLDLLGSDRFANEFVCETENDSSVYLRFGDDILGKKPAAQIKFKPKYRIGNGTYGNVGPDSIKRILTDFNNIIKVRNPLPAVGGTDPEPIEKVKQIAPQAFRVQERAVTEEDYSEVTQRHDEVQRAAADFRWTGSWNSVFVTIDRKAGLDVDEDFRNEIENYLEKYRLAGYDLEINKPIFVSLDIEFSVCVKEGYFRSNANEALIKIFSSKLLPNRKRGFFHPDNFTFGQPVFLSQLYKAAMSVEGITSIVITKFQRFGKTPNREIENGLLQPSSHEIIRLDNDPNFPEHGKINFIMNGGL